MIPPDNLATDSVREVLRLHSQRNPNADALLAPGCRPFTYIQLVGQIEYVGQALRAVGIEHSDRVAVVLPNGPDMAAAFLGIATYATCAPLNPSYRQDDFEFYLTDLGAKAIVVPADTDLPARNVAKRLGLTVIDLEPSKTQLAGAFTLRGAPTEVETPSDWGRNEDVALVLHTSGTTSRPKQVPLSHRNLCSSACNIGQILGLSHDDRCLNVMPLFHIHGLVGVLLSSMFAGGSVVCSSRFENSTFADLMRDYRPTWYSAVPTIHQSVLALAKENPAVAAGGHLRLIRSSSSALPPTVMVELEEAFRVPVIESYGMTEAAHQMASNPMPPAKRKPGAVGLPAGPEMAIMDDQGQLLSAGETGEIVIRGSNVTAGYANNPEANETAFTNGWFRTGDRGRTDDDGYFYITGRLEEMINRGGENISPREIDEALLEHPAVAQAVAFAVPHHSLGEDVAAAIVLQDEADVNQQDLREFAFTRLAEFKVPSQIIFVDAIPKGPTGKLQRIGLHEKLAPMLQAEYVAPRTEMEEVLVGLCRELLLVDQISVHDNFFRIGGDSLVAMQIVSRMNDKYGLQIPISLIFNSPQISLFAEALTDLRNNRSHNAPVIHTIQPTHPDKEATSEDATNCRVLPLTASALEQSFTTKGPLRFSIYFFSADGSSTEGGKYRMLRECSQYADRTGFSAIWLPERHFSAFGGLYPNPSVLGAAIATITEQIQIRAGSVVVPLQDPLRVAEEWSVVDNLSDGRVAIACASGWHSNDFVLAPNAYSNRRQIMLERIETIRRLWNGDTIRLPNGLGEEVEVRIFPRPIQSTLPIWLAAHSDQTFVDAGEIGANIVTNIWKTDLDQLAKQINLYRSSWTQCNEPESRGTVTLMIHTFLGESDEDVLEKINTSYGEYLISFLKIRDAQAEGANREFDLQQSDRADLVALATRRLFESHGLLGTPDRCMSILESIQNCGVDEVACLIDFGIDVESVMKSLEYLVEVKSRVELPQWRRGSE